MKMNFNDKNDLINHGFTSFISYSDLNRNEDKYIDKVKGVYLVINPDYKNPKFDNPGVCGKHGGKDPNRTITELKAKYVYDSQVMYIGKGGSLNDKAELNQRIKAYLACSRNATCGHSGGRNIWQLQNYQKLIFCWKKVDLIDSADFETELITMFINQFGKLPFANYRL